MEGDNLAKRASVVEDEAILDKHPEEGASSIKEKKLPLPPEFNKIRPFGLELYVFNIIFEGVLTHGMMLFALFKVYPIGDIPIGAFVLHLLIIAPITGFGISLGCHRYWSHKTFKANTPLRILLMLLQTATFQKSIFKWCRDHRIHHKYTDSNADPYSASRGFWFSHILWLFQPHHPDFLKKEEEIDVSDLVNDPVVRFQAKYYWELLLFTFLIVPMSITHWLYPDLTFFDHIVLTFVRYGVSMHCTFLVNSVAHIWGDKPYDKYISPVENKWVTLFAVGEGWHNYHHTFPWDYKASEMGQKYNISTFVIHLFAKIGWAWDMKTVSHKLLVDRINRTGDGSHALSQTENSASPASPISSLPTNASNCWGWGDPELRKEDIEITETDYPRERKLNAYG